MLLKTTRIAVLTVAALDDLYVQDDCCPVCCGKCWVLRDMYQKNDLDKIILRAPAQFYESASWWDLRHSTVNTAWMTGKWLASTCTHGVTEDDEEEAQEPIAA